MNNNVSKDTLEGLEKYILNKNHPANSIQSISNPINPLGKHIELQKLTETPITNNIDKQLKTLRSKNELRRNGKLNFRNEESKDKNEIGLLLTTDDIKLLNKKCRVDIDIVPFKDNMLILQWSPKAMQCGMTLLKLYKDVKNVKIPTKTPCKGDSYKEGILHPDYGKRLKQLSELSNCHKKLLLKSISRMLEGNALPSIQTMERLNKERSNKKEFVENLLFKTEHKNRALFSNSSKFTKQNTKDLIKDPLKFETNSHFKKNPITKFNFYKVPTLNKELNYITDILERERFNGNNSNRIFSIFKQKHNDVKKNLFGSLSPKITAIPKE